MKGINDIIVLFTSKQFVKITFFLSALLVVFLQFPAPYSSWGVKAALAFDAIPLTLKERSGVQRINEPVSYGIPFAKDENLLSCDTLEITDHNGSHVDAQFRVLSRYNGTPADITKPIRMVLVDFQVANITADQELTYHLKSTGSGTASGSDLASEDTSHINIDTGLLTAKINKNSFNLFDEIKIGTTTIVSGSAGDGVIIDYQGTQYTSNNAPDEIYIEENGPLKTVIKIRGFLKDGSENELRPPLGDVGIEYLIRLVFYKGKGHVRLFHTLLSNNFGWAIKNAFGSDNHAYAHNIEFDSLRLKTTLDLNSSKTIDFNGDKYDYSSGKYLLVQDHEENSDAETANFTYSIKENGTEVIKRIDNNDFTGRFDSYTDLRDTGKGLMVASRWFWQNWPKGIEANNNALEFYLWPDMATDHIFVGSWYKTHELIYHFHEAVSPDYNFSPEVATLKKRILPLVSSEYLSKTDFIDFVPPAEITSDFTFPAGETLQAPINKWNRSIRAKYNSDFSNNHSMSETFSSLREIRGFTWDGGIFDGKKMNWYGWVNFGDMARGENDGFPALHYNWEYISLIHGIRFKDYDMIELGEQMVRHKADIDIIHDPEGVDEAGSFDEDFYRGGHRYENDAHFHLGSFDYASGPGLSSPFGSSHTWIKGLAMQYLLTGNEYYKEVLDQIGAHLVYVYWDNTKSFIAPWSCKTAPCWDTNNTRTVTRAPHLLVDLYRVTGEEKYLNVAKAVFNNSVLETLEVDSKGYLKYDNGNAPREHCNYQKCDAHMFYEAIATKPIISLYYELTGGDFEEDRTKVLDYMKRKGDWFKNRIYKNYAMSNCGKYKDSQYFPYITKIDWKDGYLYQDTGRGEDMTYSLVQADLFAFLYKETGDLNWLDLARSVFKDGMMYSSGSWTDINYANLSSPWFQFKISGFAGSPGDAWLKAGKVLHKPMFYLKTEAEESLKEVSSYFTISSNPVGVNETLILDASKSTGDIVEYHWDFENDGTVDQITTLPTVSRQYQSANTYNIRLLVSDGSNTAESTRTMEVVENNMNPALLSAIILSTKMNKKGDKEEE